MTENYKVGYSEDALNDLREIYAYIANELLVPETAAAQVGRTPETKSLVLTPGMCYCKKVSKSCRFTAPERHSPSIRHDK